MLQSKIKVIYFTGSWSDYALMVPILETLKLEKMVELGLVVTHMHLDERFGLTVKQIFEKGFKIIGKIKTEIVESQIGMLSEYQVIIKELPPILLRYRPNYVLIQGDRIESAAAAMTAYLLRIPIIHIGGGCITGSLDNDFRNIITDLADWHFPPTKTDAKRIVSNGKPKNSVFAIGEPGIDSAVKTKLLPKKNLWKKFNLDSNQKLLLVIFHPDTGEKRIGPAEQIQPLLTVLSGIRHQIFQINPNADTGGIVMRRLIVKSSGEKSNWQVINNLPHQQLLTFFKYADAIIGNSSAAIVEAPSFKLPVINIGRRQKGRQMAKNILSVTYDSKQISRALKTALSQDFKQILHNCKNLYGDGNAADRFIKIFKNKILKI
ncbi:UDP-N-acetylglucosamine 2-epimerase (hydrolyzing) [Candidatus Collierbacteria bacterium]|nr:UDP-N-acetylglucosamine 2-epimerase (hydrolyzing) [Candidatus Collierbacteria bacterium]